MVDRLYIKVDSGVVHSGKLIRTAKRLGVSRTETLGCLVSLWGWAANMAETGNLAEHSAQDISNYALWRGRPQRFYGALVAESWIDPDGRLHDWELWGGAGVTERARNRERKRTSRVTVTGDSRGQSQGMSLGRSQGPLTETETETETTTPVGVAAVANALTGSYHERVPLSNFPAVAGIVRKALKAGYPAAEVRGALLRLADEGRVVTTDTLRIELEGFTPRHKPGVGEARLEGLRQRALGGGT